MRVKLNAPARWNAAVVFPNYYDILNIPVDADAETIRKMFRETMRRYHPDIGEERPHNFGLLTEGYKILRNPALRQEYDQELREEYPHFFSQKRTAAAVPGVKVQNGRPKMDQATPPAVEAPAAVVGPSVLIRGDFQSGSDVAVEGEIYGRIRVPRHCLRVERGGRVGLHIEVREADIFGNVLGDVKASRRITLRAGSRVTGTISAPSLVVEDGAVCSIQVCD